MSKTHQTAHKNDTIAAELSANASQREPGRDLYSELQAIIAGAERECALACARVLKDLGYTPLQIAAETGHSLRDIETLMAQVS